MNKSISSLQKSIKLTLLILFPFCAAAQTGTVRGFVYDKGTGEPLIFTNVLLQKTTIGAATDVNGYYSISQIPPGDYTLFVTAVGYDTIAKPITVVANKIQNHQLYLSERVTRIRTFTVTAERQELINTVRVGVTKLEPKQIEQLPSIGGEPDLAQYIQVVPGVVFTGDQGGQLYIRGGSPIQNKTLLDGMVLYNPFHSIGLYSVFDNDIIRNVDVLTGGFNAEYGGRISSVIDVTSRDGNRTRWAGKVGASTFATKALIEGPLKKATEEKPGSSSLLLNVRHSYLDQTSQNIYSYVDTAGLPFRFTDIYGKLSFNGGNGSKFNLFGFNFTDAVNYQGISDLEWVSNGGGTNFVLVPAGSPVLIEGVLAISNYEISLRERNLDPRTSSINGFNGGLNFKYFKGADELRYGVEVLGFRTNFKFFNAIGNVIEQEENTSEIAGYFNFKKKIGNWIIDPGVRLHYYASLSVASFEPRIGIKWNINDMFRLKASAGRYSQNLVAANNDRDVVNLFYGFLSSPENIPSTFTTESGDVRDVNDPLQRSDHFIIGTEIDITSELSANVEGYWKIFRQVTNLNRNKLFDDSPDFFDRPEELRTDFIIEEGDAYGVDLLLKYKKNAMDLWLVYSNGYVTRWDGSQQFPPIWDRRHNVNLVASYTFGDYEAYKLSARWNFGSGLPFSQTQGFYGDIPFSDGVNSDLGTANANLGTVLGDLNAGRLPTYHRLDIGITRTWRFSEYSKLDVNLSASNVYDRQNIFFFDRTAGNRVDQLPFLPAIGAKLSF